MRVSQLICLAVAALPTMARAKSVFAHVVMGNTCGHDTPTWEAEINSAKSSGIDGFALNIAYPWTGTCVADSTAAVFTAANNQGGFKLFFSFDFLGGSGGVWPVDQIVSVLTQYGYNAAYFTYGPSNYPYVSTFEGSDSTSVNNWSSVRSQFGGIYLVPDWTSLGTDGIAQYLNLIDGAFSWDMWPSGPYDSNNTHDLAWQDALGSKTFMMGVSPWFFTDLPAYNKAFVWRGDDTWHLRWEEVLSVNTDILEIVSWNDFGESHYIGPIYDSGIPSATNADAHWYVDNMPHDSWRDFLPFYIAQYKNGAAPTVTKDQLQYWYRLTPGAAGSNGGVTGNNCPSAINIYGYEQCFDPNVIMEDKIFFSALLTSPATVTVSVGGNTAVSYSGNTGINHWNQLFNGQTGSVVFQIVRDNAVAVSGTGTAILAAPTTSNGQTNYNAWVGSAS